MRPAVTLLVPVLTFPAIHFAAQPAELEIATGPGVVIDKTPGALSEEWLRIGGTYMGSPLLLRRLRDTFSTYRFPAPGQVATGDTGSGGPSTICVVRDGTYFSFRTGYAGPSLHLSTAKPQGSDCATAPEAWSAALQLDSGLKLGQSKTDVARLTGMAEIHDTMTLSSSYLVITSDSNQPTTRHVATIRLEFLDNRLARVDISDHRID
jgi:hypothetical protein